MKTKQTYIVAAMLLLATLYFYQDPGWNGNSRLDATRAIVERGTFRIDAYQDQPDWSTMDKSVYEGHYYTDKGIGSTLFAIPLYFVLYRLSAAVGIALTSAFVKHTLTAVIMGSAFTITGIVLYLIARILTDNPWKAALAVLAVSLGTMLWPYSAVYYGHVPAAMFLAVAFYLLLTLKSGPEAISGWKLFCAGLMMGLAFITEYPSALVIAGLLGYALYVLWGQPAKVLTRSAVAGAIGALLPLSAMLLYDASIYGSVFRFSYSHVAVPGFQAGLEQGFMGISKPDLKALYHFTFDPRFGIFWQSPVLLLAFVGFVAAFVKRLWRAEALFGAYSIAAVFLMNAGYFMWWGGSAFGARYVIPALPFFVIPLALLPDKLTWLLGGLTVVSAGQMLIPLLGGIQINVSFNKATGEFSVVAPFHGFSIMYQYGLPLMFTLARGGASPWSVGGALGLPLEASAGLLVAVEAVLARYLYQLTRSKQPGGYGR